MSEVGPFATYAVTVPEEWTDYNGHLHDASYLTALSDAHEELFAALGLSKDYRTATGAAYYTVEWHLQYKAECRTGDELRAATLMVAADPKRIRLRTDLLRGDGTLAATGEALYLHVDTRAGGVQPLAADRFEQVEAMRELHATLLVDRP